MPEGFFKNRLLDIQKSGPSFTKLFRRTKSVNAMKRHSVANFVRQIRVVNCFVKLVPGFTVGNHVI